MTIKWGLPPADRPLLTAIVERAHDLGHVATKNRTNLTMDLTACHLNGTPLDFARLLAFPEFDFAHDIHGISEHLNRSTGRLDGYFLPRCARPEDDAQMAYVLDLIERANAVE